MCYKKEVSNVLYEFINLILIITLTHSSFGICWQACKKYQQKWVKLSKMGNLKLHFKCLNWFLNSSFVNCLQILGKCLYRQKGIVQNVHLLTNCWPGCHKYYSLQLQPIIKLVEYCSSSKATILICKNFPINNPHLLNM